MKHLYILLLTTVLSINVSFAADELKLSEGEKAIHFFNKGREDFIQDNFSDAVEQFTAALDIPEFVGAKRAFCHSYFGDTHYRQGNFHEAIEQWTIALRNAPQKLDQ